MTDYIKREDAINTARNTFTGMTAETLELRIKGIPSADVAPVRHAHWIKISPAGIYECSECEKNVMTSDIKAYEYCHGCGAIMDGDNDE